MYFTIGLFSGVASFSGDALTEWSLYRPPASILPHTEMLAELMGCPIDDTQTMVDCLRTRDAMEIVTVANENIVDVREPYITKPGFFFISCFIFCILLPQKRNFRLISEKLQLPLLFCPFGFRTSEEILSESFRIFADVPSFYFPLFVCWIQIYV